MGKRKSEKKDRLSRDYYPTVDPDAVEPLKPFLYHQSGRETRYIEPCAGGGHLIDLLASTMATARCIRAYDIEPQRADISQRNCLTLKDKDLYIRWGDSSSGKVDCFITNPPFKWHMLQPILDSLPALRPTWLLLPADLMHNKRVSPYMDYCVNVVSVGRLWWFESEGGKKVKGVDNYCWYLFDKDYSGFTRFYGRKL